MAEYGARQSLTDRGDSVAMAREYRSFLLVTAEKASRRREGELLRRYVNALARSPRQWFRMRDADALARFTIASALACNDLDDVWFPDSQFEILTEIGDTLYDSIAFYKHRSGGETNKTFAYVPPDLRISAFQQCRELLWALDTVWASSKRELQIVVNFLRFFGGPMHMMMRRYRFVEEGLTVGRPETGQIIMETRRNRKLWNRIDVAPANASLKCLDRYCEVMRQQEELMFSELATFLDRDGNGGYCRQCRFRASYGAEQAHQFGGLICANNVGRNGRDTLNRSFNVP